MQTQRKTKSLYQKTLVLWWTLVTYITVVWEEDSHNWWFHSRREPQTSFIQVFVNNNQSCQNILMLSLHWFVPSSKLRKQLSGARHCTIGVSPPSSSSCGCRPGPRRILKTLLSCLTWESQFSLQIRTVHAGESAQTLWLELKIFPILANICHEHDLFWPVVIGATIKTPWKGLVVPQFAGFFVTCPNAAGLCVSAWFFFVYRTCKF